MSAEKTRAFILRTIPYRESSCILHLFTEEHGLIHGIAKGIRRKTARRDIIERGYHIELIVYNKTTRDLHTVSAIHVIEYYPLVRSNLIKSALRDAAFEMVLAAITVTDVHPELYTFFHRFLTYLDSAPEKECHPFALWLFCHRFSQHLGFGLDLQHCITCGGTLTQDAVLILHRGGLECEKCTRESHERFRLPGIVISYLRHGTPKPAQLRTTLLPKDLKKCTFLLTDYCRYHFDTQKEYKALAFLNDMAGW